MLPFLQIPIWLPGDLSANKEDKEVMARIQPDNIESFKDDYDFGCIITFKSGNIEMTKYTAEEFSAILGNYWKSINAQIAKGANGTIQLLQ